MGEIFERVVPAAPLERTGQRPAMAAAGQVEIEHLHRYLLARELCRGLDVLDLAAAEGCGAALLAQVARSVVGVQVSAAAAARAADAYPGADVRFVEGDARRLPLLDASVDAVVAFGAIEHASGHGPFLAEVRRVLRPGGRCIVSSPVFDTRGRGVDAPSGSGAGPHDARGLSRAEFGTLLAGSFVHVHLLSQRPLLGSALVSDGAGPGRTLTFEQRGPDHFEASAGLPRPACILAVASDQPVADVPDSLYIDTVEIGAVLDAKAAREEAIAACSQRDIARIAARRAAAASEGRWRGRVAELERRAIAAEQRYEGLRARLEAVLQRFWIRRAAALVPGSARRFVRNRLLGWGRQ